MTLTVLEVVHVAGSRQELKFLGALPTVKPKVRSPHFFFSHAIETRAKILKKRSLKEREYKVPKKNERRPH